jgi:hypothetical protein
MNKIIIIGILLISHSTANAQTLFGIQAKAEYNATKLYNKFDAINKRGMNYAPSYNRPFAFGLNLYFKDKWNFSLDATRQIINQNYTFDFISGGPFPFDHPQQKSTTFVELKYNGVTASINRLFGQYNNKVRPFVGLGVSYNYLQYYMDAFYFTRPKDSSILGESGYNYTFLFGNGNFESNFGSSQPQVRPLSKWLYQRTDMRLAFNLGAQLQVTPHVFILFGVQGQQSMNNIETPGAITASKEGITVPIKNLGLQERYDCKYPTGTTVKVEQRLAPTYVQIAGGYLGARFQFGKIME